MKPFAIISALVLFALANVACDRGGASGSGSGSADQAAPREISVQQASALLRDHRATAIDANSDETRRRFGVIPNAVLLTSSSEYPLSQLPADHAAKLVFYCANTRCSASDEAAERAVAAGYAEVHVLRAGIAGWKEAGQPTRAASGS